MSAGPAARTVGRPVGRRPVLTKGEAFIDRLILPGASGFAVEGYTGQMRVYYPSTPAKNYLGPFAAKMFVNGVLTPGPNGIRLDLANFLRFNINDWPYKSTAITVAGRARFVSGTDADLRWLWAVDTGGNDALAVFVGAAGNKLTLFSGSGASADNTAAVSAIVAGQPFDFVFSAGPDGKFVAINRVVEASRNEALAANASPLGFHGIGAPPASTGNFANSNPANCDLEYLVVEARAIEPAMAELPLPFAIAPDVYLAIGDSISLNTDYGMAKSEFHPAVVAARLGCLCRNLGVSGNTSAQAYGRRADGVKYGVPKFVEIEIGGNDVMRNTTVSASPTPTSSVFTVASALGYVAKGYITVAGEAAQIASIAGNQITLTGALVGGAPAAGAAVKIDTQANIEGLISYFQGQGATRIFVVGWQYLNFASGGDTTSAQQSLAAACRALQAAAAAAKGVPYVDCYDRGKQLILSGAYSQGDDLAWHVAVSDVHPNPTGQRVVLADAISATIAAQGWA